MAPGSRLPAANSVCNLNRALLHAANGELFAVTPELCKAEHSLEQRPLHVLVRLCGSDLLYSDSELEAWPVPSGFLHPAMPSVCTAEPYCMMRMARFVMQSALKFEA